MEKKRKESEARKTRKVGLEPGTDPAALERR